MKITKKKCNIKKCLNEENEECTIDVPTLINEVKPGSESCRFFETKEMMLEIIKRKKLRFKDESKTTKKRSKKNK